MGIDITAEEVILGYELTDFAGLLRAFNLLDSPSSNKKSKQSADMGEDEVMNDKKNPSAESNQDSNDDDDYDPENDYWRELDVNREKDRDLISRFRQSFDEESFNREGFWKQFLNLYDAKYPGLKDSGLSAFSGLTYERNLDSDYTLEWYKFFFGLKLSEKSVSEKGALSVKLPPQFPEITKDFLAFLIKFGKRWIFTSKPRIELAVIGEEEAAELVARSEIVLPEAVEIHKIISVC